jgi:hypothetical protein
MIQAASTLARSALVSAFLAWMFAVLLIILTGGLASAGRKASIVSKETIRSLDIHPKQPTLWGRGAVQRFVVMARFSDGMERDVTSETGISISPPGVAKLDLSGQVVAVGAGEAVVKAEVGAHTVATTVRVKSATPAFDFQREIGGILTKRGCNGSDCHGSVKGRGGFKLSLNGLRPSEDYEWIVKGGTFHVLTDDAGKREPRIDVEDPQDSLLLLKPTREVSHRGGKRFDLDSADYNTILAWVREGAPHSEESATAVRVERLEVFPRPSVLAPDWNQQLLVIAVLADGRREDFTHRVHYASNNEEVVEITEGGLVQAVSPGETSVLIRASGHVVDTRVAVIARRRPFFSDIPPNNFIDEYVFAKLEKFHLLPSKLASDAEFLRRVCLDVTGTLPPPERVREFLSDDDPRKRENLIEILLDSPEYVDYWTFRFADLFRATKRFYWRWIRDCVARNKPYDQMARERLASQGFDRPSRFYSMAAKARPVQRVVAEDFRVFLGQRMDCAECHDHPFETWSQDQFWGLAAFYGRMTLTEWVSPVDLQVVLDDPDGQEVDWGMDGTEALEFIKIAHPRTKKSIRPRFFDGRKLPAEMSHDPRSKLAEWVTSHPYFARAIVNRMWSYFFGRGIIDPVDNFSATNPPTHPELLDALAQYFRENGHDLKALVRLIVRSRAYQRSSIPNDSNRDDTINYSHALPRPLDAEVLLDAIVSATGVPMVFQRDLVFQPGVVATAPLGTRAIQFEAPANFLSRFLEVYGRPFRVTVDERDSRPNLTQALHLLVGSTYANGLSKDGGRIGQLIRRGASNREMIEELYFATLSRSPTEDERSQLQHLLRQRSSIVEKAIFAGNEVRRQAIENLLWALLASREFAHNH